METRRWKQPCLSLEGGRTNKGRRSETRREKRKGRKREKERERKNSRGQENGTRGTGMGELARISTIYTHVGGTAVVVAAAISSIFRFSPFPGSLAFSTNPPSLSPACLLLLLLPHPWRNGSTGSLAVVLSDRA